MSNVIKPEQIKSSKTAGVGEIPVINDSTCLFIPYTLLFTSSKMLLEPVSDGTLRLTTTKTYSSTYLSIKPSGSSTTSAVRLKNSSSETVYGYVDIKLTNTTLNLLPGNIGGGTTPNDIQWNSNIIWNAGNDGHGSGLDADTIDSIDSSDLVVRNSARTITVQHTFNPSTPSTAPFLIGANAANQRVVNLCADSIYTGTTYATASATPVSGQVPVLYSGNILKLTGDIEVGPAGKISASPSSTTTTLTFVVRNSGVNNSIFITPKNTTTVAGTKANIFANSIYLDSSFAATILTATTLTGAPLVVSSTTM